MAVIQERAPFRTDGVGGLGARRFVVNVLSTNERETYAALEAAAVLARNLDAVIRVVSFQIVPYPLELNEPCIPPGHTVAQLTPFLKNVTTETCVQVYYCRDIAAALVDTFAPKSLVIIGRKRRVWAMRANALTRLLRSCGHELVVVEVK
jgi:hypothetical protein